MSVLVKTADDQLIEIESPLIRHSGTLRTAIADPEYKATEPIFLKDVNSAALANVLKWLRHHCDDDSDDDSEEDVAESFRQRIKGRRTKEYRWRRRYMYVPKWDKNFLETDNSTVIGIVNTAHYLKIKKLMDYACRALAGKMKNKSPEEIRNEFNIENDFDDDEDEIVFLSLDKSRTAKYKVKCAGS